MGMYKLRAIIAITGACALLAGIAATAQAEETLTITEAGFSPDALGVPTNAFGRAKFGSTNTPIPSPITHVNVYGPAGATENLEGTGVCTAQKLENIGPEACPADSRAGFGGVEGVYEIAGEVVHENASVDYFLGDNNPNHTTLLVYVDGTTPVSIQLVFTADVVHGPPQYGLGFSLNVPLIKVLPEASDASVEGAFLTIGAKNVAYYRTVHGKRKLFHVKGLITPKTCPHGGWPVETQVSFQDGSTVTAKSKIACPKKMGARHSPRGKKKKR
jgi:hypothetical protein